MDRIDSILEKMSLEEKIFQLTQYPISVFIDTKDDLDGPRKAYQLSGKNIALLGTVINPNDADEMIKAQEEHLRTDPNHIPLVFMRDVIHGYRTIYPIPLALAGSFNPELAEECAKMAAKEAALSGVQVTFAPMADYVRDPRWGRVLESGGEEPLVTGIMGAAQARGFQGDDLSDKDHIAACVKHFAAYGAGEAGREYNLAEVSLRELYEHYLPAYKMCIDAGVKLLMPSFNSVNGVPSTVNSFLMKKVLKEEWNYDGAVISDMYAVSELIPHGVAEDLKEAAEKAFTNGCDIEMCSSSYVLYLKELVEEGRISEEKIDEAARRVLMLKERLGLFEDPYHGADQKAAEAFYLCDENRALARRAAEESAVLLKNDGLLPLSPDVKRVALIGPFADSHEIKGAWSCKGRDEECVSMEEGVRKLLPDAEITVVSGCGIAWNETDADLQAAEKAANSADVVLLCLGEEQFCSGEAKSRTDLSLSPAQTALARTVLAANPNTAVVLFTGRPLAIPELSAKAPAILCMFFPGSEGGNAAANLLFGIANPSGKLTMSFPQSAAQCPVYYDRTNTGRPNWTDKAERLRYASDYIDCATLPLYSFGHGLSYSNFVYEEMKLSAKELPKSGSIGLSIKIKNESDISGSEVVQVYMKDPVASVVRPLQKLIAFKKVSFKPHEEKTVLFELNDSMFLFCDMEGKRIRETGRIEIMTGEADHFVLKDEFEMI